MTIAFCMSGGGEKGLYGIGAYRHWIVNLGIDPDIYVGISVGDLVSASMAQFSDPIEGLTFTETLFMNVVTEDVHKPWFLGYLGATVAAKPSLRNSGPLRKLIREHVKPERIFASGKKLIVGAVSYHTGRYELFDQDHPDIVQAVEASASFPVFFEPVPIGDHLYGDGGIRTVSPILAAIKAGADTIYAVTLSPDKTEQEFPQDPAWWDVATRALSIQSDEIVACDIKQAQLYNAAILLTERLVDAGMTDEQVDDILEEAGLPVSLADKRYVTIHHIRPQKRLPTTMLKFDPTEGKLIHQLGYGDCIEYMRGRP